ncbi:TonB-dependent receptor [Nitrospirillum iridis]|uniref:TonB-dependent receptor n=1 Tax=Nitrospirillum iridis TaxID=765888 RepID=A0A7X0AWT6_9PROT|nr:TonB-dependent receptor [Nitrospirillum iridis]MBB6250751.1 TonB-dependent receptor [Nitrospirillum iridis]
MLKDVLLCGAMATALLAAPTIHAAETTTSTGDGQLEEILVFANRDQADNGKMRSSNTVDIMSAADLEHTAVHNVAEALGLLPGITVSHTGQSVAGGIDGASRGEGMLVAVRGMNSEFAVDMMNGVEVAQGLPYSRSVQLDLLPPSGLQTIVVNKTLDASMSGDAISGTVDFRTPTAFDFNQPLHFSVQAGSRLESRARDYGNSGLGGNTAAEIASQFGRDNAFGVYVSGYYDKRYFTNSELAGIDAAHNDGGWGFAVSSTSNGQTNPAGVDPASNLRQTGISVGVSDGSTERYGGNLSLDWRPDDTTSVFLRGSFARENAVQNSTLSQIISTNKSWNALSNGLYGLSVDKYRTAVWYETNPERADLSTVQLGGEKKLGALTLTPTLFFSAANNDRPNHIEASIRNDQYSSSARFSSGIAGMGTNDGYPVPVFSPGMYDALNNAATSLWARRAGQLTQQGSQQDKYGAKLDGRYDMTNEGPLSFIQAGVKYVESTRQVTNRDWTNTFFSAVGYPNSTWSSLGIADGSYSSVYPGRYSWSIPKVNQQALLNYFYQNQTASSFDTCNSNYADNQNCNTLKGREQVSAAYVMANLQFGAVEVIPGVRFEHTDIHNTFWVLNSSGATIGHWGTSETTYNEPLPSLLLNWRPSDDTVYRASVTRSYTRPALVQLGASSTVSTSADTGVQTITQGNPNLKPIESTNVDVSGEWRNSQGGQASVAGYYKRLSNYLFDNGSTLVNPFTTGSSLVSISQPRNGGSGDVYGMEFSARQKFDTILPGWMSGFSIGGNLTRQWSVVDTGIKGLDTDQPIQNAPGWLANATLSYEIGGFTADLTYNYTGSYLVYYDYLGQGGSWDNMWVRPTNRLDLHVGYKLDNGVSIDGSVSNLTNNYTYWAHIGKNSLTLSNIVDSGATALMTVKYTY